MRTFIKVFSVLFVLLSGSVFAQQTTDVEVDPVQTPALQDEADNDSSDENNNEEVIVAEEESEDEDSPRRFIPTEEISQDLGVSFPADI